MLRFTDLFALINTSIFGALFVIVYFEPFVQARGVGNLHEFFFYACSLLALTVVLWLALRRIPIPVWMLLLAEAGVLMHFAGGLVSFEGARLYDAVFFGLGYDKYVHLLNALAGSVLVDHLLGPGRHGFIARNVIVLMIVLGGGAVVEMLEYVVTLAMPNSGVGDYDNNMRDLVANLAGALAYIPLSGLLNHRSRGRALATA